MAMAMLDSVTVSISDEMIGMWRRSESERLVAVSASLGRISECRVASETSSKVSAVGKLARKKASAGK
jgi:hypothetical protein